MTAVTVLHYDIPDQLHRKVKAAAALRGLTLKDFVIEVLKRATADEPQRKDTGRSSKGR